MKELNELNLPEELRYSEEHEWAKQDGDTVLVGITDYAQDQLGDIVYVELPQVGAVLEKGAVFGSLESVKAVSEVFMPVAGEVTAVNSDLENTPEAVNKDPYGAWLVRVKPSDASGIDALMTREAYLNHLKG